MLLQAKYGVKTRIGEAYGSLIKIDIVFALYLLPRILGLVVFVPINEIGIGGTGKRRTTVWPKLSSEATVILESDTENSKCIKSLTSLTYQSL